MIFHLNLISKWEKSVESLPRTTVTLELYSLLRLASIPFPFSVELFDDMIPIYLFDVFSIYLNLFRFFNFTISFAVAGVSVFHSLLLLLLLLVLL